MRRVLALLVFLAAIIGAVLIYRNAQARRAAESQVNRLQTAMVERGDVMVAVRTTGQVEPLQSARLQFEVAGVVEAVLVEAGQAVQAGEVLARLDGEAQRIAVEQAELGLRIAQLNLEALLEPPSERELEVAQANVNSAWAAYVDLRDNSLDPETLRVAELRYEQALAAVQDAEQAYRDTRGSELAEAQVGAASFSAEIARLQLEQLRQGPSQAALNAAQAQVAQAQAELERLRAGPTQAELDRAAVAAQQAELQLERARAAYEDTVLRAPFDGVVSRVNVVAGGLAGPSGLPAVEVVDLSRLRVVAEVDEVDIAQVRAGQSAVIALDALPGQTFTGTVERIAPVPAPDEGVVSYEVSLSLGATAASVRAGMTAAATIIVQEVEDVLVVPNLYVRLDRASGEAFVNVLDADGNLVERAVELGAQGETLSEVRSGLQEGDVVAIDLEGGAFSFLESEE